MQSDRGFRVGFGLLLLAVCATMSADYARHVDDHRPYPTHEELAADYEAYVGADIHFWARVSMSDAGSITVDYYGTSLEITDLEQGAVGASPGDTVQVYGTIRPDGRIAAESVVVSSRVNREYMYVVSVLAIVLTTLTFFRAWTFDWSSAAFIPRDGQ